MKKLASIICTFSLTLVAFSIHASEKFKHQRLTKDVINKQLNKKTKAALIEDLKDAKKTIATLKKGREELDAAYDDELRSVRGLLEQTEEERDDYKQKSEIVAIEKATLIAQRDLEISILKGQNKALEDHARYTQQTLLDSIHSLNITVGYQDEKLRSKRQLITKLQADLAATRKQSVTRSPSWQSMYA